MVGRSLVIFEKMLVRPILSLNHEEARKRVLTLYRAWYRQLPYIITKYDVPVTLEQSKCKLREEFRKHDEMKDIRVIDLLVIRGQMELKDTVNVWKQRRHIMQWFHDTIEPKPTDFLSKFVAGHD